MKVARTVWSRGKGGDNFKALPIAIKRKVETFEHDPVEKAEAIISGYTNPPKITHAPGGAWYKAGVDQVNVPKKNEFKDVNKYYSTIFHELVHSTGHKQRLKRDGIANTSFFESLTYSKEELVAEIGASFLCAMAGIDNTTLDNSAAYIQGWLGVLKDDPKMVVHASQQAQKAADWILGKQKEE